MSLTKQLWYKVGAGTPIETIEKAFNQNFNSLYIHCNNGNVEPLTTILPKKFSFTFEIDTLSDVEKLFGNEKIKQKTGAVCCKDLATARSVTKRYSVPVGLYLQVNDRETLDYTVNVAAPETSFMVIEFKDPTNIPLELVLAKTQGTKTSVFKRVTEPQDGEVSMMTMEKGSDGIVFENDNLDKMIEMDRAYEKVSRDQYGLQPAVVKSITHAGMGDRVCIDTTSELGQDEGMILGSTSTGGLMVCSETHYLPYMNLRPFRVNAGGLHMYVWGPNNFVAYLSELKAGDEVFAVNSKGEARVVTVGRVKIERRPLLKIEAEINGTMVNTFIQDDWHVRVFGSNGEIIPSAEVVPGTCLLGFIDEPGRHVGVKISETIKEQ